MLSKHLRFGKIVQRRGKENITGMAGSAQTTRPADIKSQVENLAEYVFYLSSVWVERQAHPPTHL
jgi:hypothetical protein